MPLSNDSGDECTCEDCRMKRYFHTQSLTEAVWIWREKLELLSLDEVVDKLAQEARMYLDFCDEAAA